MIRILRSLIICCTALFISSCPAPYVPPAETYTVTYNSNGATSGSVPVDNNAYAEWSVAVVADPGQSGLSRDSYTFAWWNDEADGSGASYRPGAELSISKGNISLYAQWSHVPTYSVQYFCTYADATGEVLIDSNAYEEDDAVTVLGPGTRAVEGYTFAGWGAAALGTDIQYYTGDVFKIGAASVTLYARWSYTPDMYSVLYYGNGATSGEPPADSKRYEESSSAIVLDQGSLLRSAFTFIGWNTASDGSGVSYTAGAALKLGNANATLFAQWKHTNTYSVVYDGNGATSGSGSVPADHNVYETGDTVTVLGAGSLSRDGYTFEGWNSSKDGTGKGRPVGSAFSIDSSDVTLYARWTVIPVYPIVYDAIGGSGSLPATRSYLEGAAVTVLGAGDLTKPGYAFQGWRYISSGVVVDYSEGDVFTMPAANVSMYARWALIPTFTVAYYANGGSGTVPSDIKAYEAGATVSVAIPNGLSKVGYACTGWNTAAAGTGVAYTAGSTFEIGAANMVLYAQWKRCFNIYYYLNDGTSVSIKDPIPYGSGDTAIAAGEDSYTRAGYVFSAWNTAANGTGASYSPGAGIVIATSDIGLFAQWSAVYSVSFHANGGAGSLPDAVSGIAGVSVPIASPGGLSREGFKFASWNTAPNGSGESFSPGTTLIIGDGSKTLYAQWTALPTYKVTYDANGGIGSAPTDTRAYWEGTMATVLSPGSLARSGYTFVGWNTEAAGTGASRVIGEAFAVGSSDAILYAQWSVLPTYTVYYDPNGGAGTVPSDANKYLSGSKAPVIANGGLSRNGYVFAGWNTLSTGSGTAYAIGSTLAIGSSDVTLFAQWSPVYSVLYFANGGTGVEPSDQEEYLSGAFVTVVGKGSLSRTGYTFAGWNTAPDGSGAKRGIGSTFAMMAADVRLYAQWTVDVGLRITFSQPADETITLGSAQSVCKSSSLAVSIAEPFDEYLWYVDGDLLPSLTGQSATIALSAYSYGNHTLTVVLRKGALWYSKTLYFTVKA